MYMRRVGVGFLAALLVTLAGGCKKSPSTESPEAKQTQSAQPSAPLVETVARVHWLGKKRLATETNAAAFMALWNLPQSAHLEAQTLDKLAIAPWLLRAASPSTNGQPCLTNYPSATLLRPLLDDLVQEESYFELRNATNLPGELALAIRLNSQRAALWETNLAAALESLTGTRPTPAQASSSGWQWLVTNQLSALRCLQLTRAGDWTILGLAPDKNGLVADLLARIQKDQVPYPAPATNYWVEADLDLPRVASALACGWKLPQDLAKVSLAVIGDGQNVRTRGELKLVQPLACELDRWIIPTNLIQEPLVSFSAVRGIKPWLSSLLPWTELQTSAAPNQLYSWSLEGPPGLNYFAASVPGASNLVDSLCNRLLNEANPWLVTNAIGKLERSTNFNGILWTGFPFLAPYLKSISLGENDFVFGGLNPEAPLTRPIPGELIRQLDGSENLVCYNWEMTGPRVQAWLYYGQLGRVFLHKAQLPSGSAGLAWLKNVGGRLGNCATEVVRTKPDQLTFARKSSVGFSGLELHLLADWLESPQFPLGAHTLLAPAPLSAAHRTKENSSSPSR